MPHAFFLKFGLGGPSQTDLVAALKTLGADSIQTGNGLCVKSPLAGPQLREKLSAQGLGGFGLEPVNPEGDLTPDVAAFLGQ